MSDAHWIIAHPPEDGIERLCREAGLPRPVAIALYNRGIVEPEAAKDHLARQLSDLPSPLLLPDMAQAVTRIWQALNHGEKILVFGDYDVDGVTSTALVYTVLCALGADCVTFIPHRVEDGYGFTPEALALCIERHRPNLIITVDCGSGSIDAVAQAHASHIDVIVTDHHEVGGTPAEPLAFVNPKRGDSASMKELAGVGVAFMLAYGVVKEGRVSGHAIASTYDLREVLDLVAIGTIADMVPLRNENRIFARAGLRRINKSLRPGIQALCEIAGLMDKGRPITCGNISFQIGPRINAAGRLDHPDAALKLLLESDIEIARVLASDLDAANTERRTLEEEVFSQAVRMVSDTVDLNLAGVLVVAKAGWHVGVIGIVASRLVRLYHRPVVVIALDEKTGFGKGSCRSVDGVHFVEHLEKVGEHLRRFGGHAMAAGLEIAVQNIPDFSREFNEVVSVTRPPSRAVDVRKADGWLEPEHLTVEVAMALEELQPFGIGNPEPVWAARGLIVQNHRVVGEKHLKMTLRFPDDRLIDGIAFGLAGEPLPKEPLDVLFQLQNNVWNNNVRPQLMVQDWRVSTHSHALPQSAG